MIKDKALAQPEQEPVAKVCHDLDGHIGWNPDLKQLPNEGTPLYTTPPQRKPLTDEDMEQIAKKFSGSHASLVRCLREVEAALGIKDNS
jgi:hypothetical protein